MKEKAILAEAAKLPEKQRASIATQLLNTLESTHHWVSDDEVARRLEEADADPNIMLTFEEFCDGIQTSGN